MFGSAKYRNYRYGADDHMFDHLRIWTTWKQCEEEYRKASVADTKDLEMLGK